MTERPLSPSLTPKRAVRMCGTEPFHRAGERIGPTLQEFWCWASSDLLINTFRGVLAEFLVATALGIPTDGVRAAWDAHDLTMRDGLKIEVKSAAYLQSWAQRGKSPVLFRVPATRAWSSETNVLEQVVKRQADLYVFALLAHDEKATVDPLNVAQWEFYVVLTAILDQRTRSQHSIALATLRGLDAGPFTFEQLPDAVRAAGASRATGAPMA